MRSVLPIIVHNQFNFCHRQLLIASTFILPIQLNYCCSRNPYDIHLDNITVPTISTQSLPQITLHPPQQSQLIIIAIVFTIARHFTITGTHTNNNTVHTHIKHVFATQKRIVYSYVCQTIDYGYRVCRECRTWHSTYIIC